ncbi:hypothetical protein ACL02T_26720 [Pseudonocardia sp. RS010]|uniref:hypothetical protein n=1 Tax=Pseudonocardia sp. RS010 TaxID=3385979 RepID=UPI0039A2F540
MNAAVPPAAFAFATACSATVVLPLGFGPPQSERSDARGAVVDRHALLFPGILASLPERFT